MRRATSRLAYLIAIAVVVIPGVAVGQQQDTTRQPLTAQDSARARQLLEQQFGQGVTQSEVIERLRQSGLSRAQVRARLQQMGYDPGLADRAFDVIERGGEPPRGEASPAFLSALQRIGILQGMPDSLRLRYDSLAMDSLRVDSLALDTAEIGLPIFGRSIFQRRTNLFEPIALGPVDPDYQLGPGDQIVLILTGDVELAYTLDVTREGYVIIPDVGQVFVNGLTLGQLESRLYERLGRVYSGVHRGPEATTHFQVSLGRLRTNQVYVMGDVERPGQYQVSAAGTVFNVLYQAGGPTRTGSFRRVLVRRGGTDVREVDLYDYLLRGDSRNDVRLAQGDIIFVPVAETHVSVEGLVRREAIFEAKPGEGLRDVLSFAGGLKPDAVVRRIQVDRIVPAAERRPGIDRVLVDVDVRSLADAEGERIAVQDGDAVRVFGVSERRRHRITIVGQVRRPGVYEWSAGDSLWDIIERAEGLDERAYTPRAHIFRLEEATRTRRLIQTPLLSDSAGNPVQDVALADQDSVVIYSRENLVNPDFVSIDGFVKEPGTYELSEGMTLKDLILAADGFVHGAHTLEAEVARMPDIATRTDTVAQVMRIPLGVDEDGNPVTVRESDPRWPEIPDWTPSATDFVLEHGDHVFVRRAPGYEPLRTVVITGEVVVPGTYVLDHRLTRVTDILRRAGGVTREAQVTGFQLFRDSSLVATDLERALDNPASSYNFALERGDSLHVPKYDPTVLVTGTVAFETRVPFVDGEDLDYYIKQAGGYSDLADRDRVSITYQNGRRAIVDRVLIFARKPRPRAGSTIFVPAVPESERGTFDLSQFVTTTLGLISSTVTILVLIRQLN